MTQQKHFKPRAHILKLLGEELIKSPIMAIYELVKNSYDADASTVSVKFTNIEDLQKATITIEDNGTGLTADVIENIWLEPGADHRKPIDKDGNRQIIRTPIYNRVPIGEKGVGRFAVHKLGDAITLTTRPADVTSGADTPLDYEITLTINWRDFAQSEYLEQIPVTWNTEFDKSKFYFKRGAGTKIEISSLKEIWTQKMAGDLSQESISMLSPKNDSEKFFINLDFGNNWQGGFLDPKEFLDIAPYKYIAELDEEFNLTVDYEFSLQLDDGLGERSIKKSTRNIRGELLVPILRKELEDNHAISSKKVKRQIAEFENYKNLFGNIKIEMYSYDLDAATLKCYTHDAKGLKDFLKKQHGIKVFRDDLRVLNYGELGNDWLELDIKRVQQKEWFSNNQNVGYVLLDAASSACLVEQTNREGFIDNEAYQMLYKSVTAVLTDFKNERLIDRNKLLKYLGKMTDWVPKKSVAAFHELIDATDFSEPEKKERLKKEARKLQKDFEQKQETLLVPAGVGMTASVALHEIEKLVPRLRNSVNKDPYDRKLTNEQVDELHDYMQGILSVLRKGGNKPLKLKEAIQKAVANYSFKFSSRDIEVEYSFASDLDTVVCDKRYFITMIMNLADNSVYWLDTVYKEGKGIFIKTYWENGKPCVLVVDNGPGLKDDLNDIVTPFFTRKGDGIGLGLYLIDTIMLKYGKLEIVDSQELEDLNIPDKYRGAAFKLTFNQHTG